jgi:hypothetical protein
MLSLGLSNESEDRQERHSRQRCRAEHADSPATVLGDRDNPSAAAAEVATARIARLRASSVVRLSGWLCPSSNGAPERLNAPSRRREAHLGKTLS